MAPAWFEVRTLHDPALHRHSALLGADDLAVTENVAARSLTLPMAKGLRGDAFERIAALVARARVEPFNSGP